MGTRLLGSVAAVLALAAAALPVLARQVVEPKDIVRAQARFAAPEVPAGGTARLEVTLAIEPGWHIYGEGDPYGQQNALKVTEGAEGLTVGAFAATTPPKPHKYEFDDAPRMEYEGSVTYAAEVKVPAGTAPGERRIKGAATVNACDEKGCLPTGDTPFEARLVVTAGAPGTGTGSGTAPPPVDPRVDATEPAREDSGLGGGFLLAAVIAGLLTIATPCVFPMLPLTVSILTKRAQAEPGKVLSNAAVYWTGMFTSIAGLGLAMSLLLGVAPSDFALSPGFNIGIFVFLIFLALSLFGLFDLRLPAFLTDWAQSKTGAGGAAGLFFMGVLLAFSSFACAAPFAGVIVLKAREDLLVGVVGMTVYAATFATPFFLLALFPGLLQKLPRSGGWLNAVKVVMGFVEVAAAFKFLRAADQLWDWGLFSFEVVLAIWVACALGAAIYLLGFLPFPGEEKPEKLGLPRLGWALAFAGSAVYLFPGLFGRPLPAYVESFIIRDEVAASVAVPNGGKPEHGLSWIRNDLDAALAEAKAAGKPVFVDFTGFG
ncbi:MAG TPA: cytochrome c biogenesis protein CcdA [Planctomycetota bacterium]|nr:cytochrome c biogenesis protein CcdA [Planctomycetota bacterium]